VLVEIDLWRICLGHMPNTLAASQWGREGAKVVQSFECSRERRRWCAALSRSQALCGQQRGWRCACIRQGKAGRCAALHCAVLHGACLSCTWVIACPTDLV
jgi:hypothetical protein